MVTLLCLFLPAVASMLFTMLLRRYALKINLLDKPNLRSSHVVPIPRGGGMAIALVFIVVLFSLFVYQKLDKSVLVAFIGAGTLVASVGLWDDIGGVSPLWRLIVHFLAVVWGMAWLGIFPSDTIFGNTFIPGWLGYGIFSVILVWLLNLFNFMDGIDGIAASETIFVAGSGLLFAGLSSHVSLQLTALVLIGSVLGFLFWNWPPAKIFMGDAGSGFLGITLGLYACYSFISGVTTLWVWLILFGVFFIDATYTLIRRIISRQNWYQAHRCHAYQHAAMRWGHLRVTLTVSLINILWLLPIAYLANVHRAWGGGLALLALSPLLMAAYALRAGENS